MNDQWVIVEMAHPADGDASVFGPFESQDAAFAQAEEWHKADGHNWTYLPVRIEPPMDWVSEDDA